MTEGLKQGDVACHPRWADALAGHRDAGEKMEKIASAVPHWARKND
jgi:hypothetical protein